MKFKLILSLLFVVFLLNPTQGETEENITVEIHQIWDFFNNKDASVTEIITSNGDINISGNIEFQDGSHIYDYFVYINDSNNLPETTIYRPTIKNRMEVPTLSLIKNKKMIRKYTFFGISQPEKINLTDSISFEIGAQWFPLDEYNFLLSLPVREYYQIYSANIIFPASFKIKNSSVDIISPVIQQTEFKNGILMTFSGLYRQKKMPESYIIEEYKYKTYIPLKKIPNLYQINKYPRQNQTSNKNYLKINYTYERPFLFKLIFGISIILMGLVTYLSIPLNSVKKKKNYLLTMVSIWAGQEGVSFLQGHRPLEITLYDFTIVIILLPLFIYCIIFIKKLYFASLRKTNYLIKFLNNLIHKSWVWCSQRISHILHDNERY